MRVRLLPIARREINEASEFYESRQEGLWDLRFLDAVDDAVDKIGLNPLGYAKFVGENRRCNLERFPFSLFFKVRDDVVIVACIRGSRDPQLVRERAAGIIPLKKPEP